MNRKTERPGDLLFGGIARFAAFVTVLALAAVAVFLGMRGVPGMTAAPEDVKHGTDFVSFVLPLVFGTVWSAALALLFATPIAIGVALFISHYAPRRLAGPIGYVIDLLAAVPSVVFGAWGMATLAPALSEPYAWLEKNLGFLPLFAGPASVTGRTMLTAALVLALMVLPMMTALCREMFLQTPRLQEEAALALGATRWEMIRLSVLSHARSGIVSAMMLSLGRALGETMAVTMVLSASGIITFNLISAANPSTIAANIALSFGEASGLTVNALIASGLVLFGITLVVNLLSRLFISRPSGTRGVKG